MRVEGVRTLSGPNIYTYRPALLMRLDLEDLAGRESKEIEGFNGRLLSLLPGLSDHHCAKGRPGGFVERLEEGTYFGHVVEHAALELTKLAGIPVTHGKTRESDERGVYNVVVEFEAEEGTRYLLGAAVELVDALVAGREFALAERLDEARRVVADTELGPSTRSIIEAARRRGIPWARVGDGSLVRLGWGRKRKFVQAAMTDLTSAVAADLVSDKDLTKRLLAEAAVPTPRGELVASEPEAVAALGRLGPPVVVKPLDGRQGMGVSLGLRTPAEVAEAFRVAQRFASRVLVEEMFVGRNYRVLVVGGRAVAASEREPCGVRGDGAHTVAELIELENRSPLRGEGHEKPLTKIVVDAGLLACLSKSGRTLADVPAEGETVHLRDGINLSTGGTARDVTDEMHPTIARLCERAARAVGMDVCGIDLLLADIARPFERGAGGVIEVNAAPGLRMHLHPSEGKPRDVGADIVEMLYPEGDDGRIPVVSVTGTNGKTTVTRMIAHVLSHAGLRVGCTTTDGIYVGGELIEAGDTTGPASARTVLSDPTLEAAVLETARGGIIRRGLGYDWSDVGVLTNIQPDHFGQDGIESLDDILYIKSLVAERVRDGGTLVLNADDEELARLAEEPRVEAERKRVVYFSARENHLLVRRQVDAGGTAYVLKDGWAVEATKDGETRVVEIASVPVTMRGAAAFQSANILAAAAACRAQGVAPEVIAAALATFRSESDNPGRMNLYRTAAGAHVLLDYGHNPEAFRAICRMVAAWQDVSVTGIVGVPGDRTDELIRESARVAARGFRRLIIKEDADTRGRRRGEVADLICRTAREEVPGLVCEVIWDEPAALERELAAAGPRDVIVMFYDKLEPLVEVLARHGAVPAAAVEGLALSAPPDSAEPPRHAAPLARRAAAGQSLAERGLNSGQHRMWR
jgi:cyanophycin synthetase